MKSLLFSLIIKSLFAILTPNLAQKLYETLIEKIDKYVVSTAYTIDDIIWATIKTGGEAMQEVGDYVLDFAENYVIGSKSKTDDALVLPLCKLLRETINIPDND